MKTIVCKYLPATSTKPARVKAMAEGVSSVVVTYNSGAHDPWREAAIQLVNRMGWGPVWLSHGVLPCGSHVFIMILDGTLPSHCVDVNFHGHIFLVP